MSDEQKTLTRALQPFQFFTRLNLSELLGLRAATLGQLLELIKKVPGSCIYHHTHRFLQLHEYLSPEPPNDFAYWVSDVLGEDELGERLASIDTVRYPNIRSLREAIIAVIEEFLKENRFAKLKFARPGEEFHFIKSVTIVIPTSYVVYDLKEFVDALRKVTMESVYFHIFEARLRLEKPTNDFALWIETSLGDKALAMQLTKLDPYTRTLEDLRRTLIALIEKRIL